MDPRRADRHSSADVLESYGIRTGSSTREHDREDHRLRPSAQRPDIGTDQASPFDYATAYLMGNSASPRHARPGVPTGIIFETDGQPQTQNYTCQQAQTAASAAKAKGIEVFTIGFFASTPQEVTAPTAPGRGTAGRSCSRSRRWRPTRRPRARRRAMPTRTPTTTTSSACQPRSQLDNAFTAAAFALAGGSRLVQLSPQPIVTSVSPNSGVPKGGGTTVTIGGQYFTDAYSVTFNGANAQSFTVNNDSTITARVPPGLALSTVHVVVSTPGGSSNAAGAGPRWHVRAVAARPKP